MNEQSQPRPDDQAAQTRSFLPVAADPFAPTQQFPAASYATERFPTEQYPEPEPPAERFYEPPRPAERPHEPRYATPQYGSPQYATPQYAEPRLAAQPLAAPMGPLAHEGGFAYGNVPAAPYGPMDPYIPLHLHMPQPFAYGQFPQQFGYPQQMVVVNGGDRRAHRVNHALHLVLSVVTFGLWLPVWVILAIANS